MLLRSGSEQLPPGQRKAVLPMLLEMDALQPAAEAVPGLGKGRLGMSLLLAGVLGFQLWQLLGVSGRPSKWRSPCCVRTVQQPRVLPCSATASSALLCTCLLHPPAAAPSVSQTLDKLPPSTLLALPPVLITECCRSGVVRRPRWRRLCCCWSCCSCLQPCRQVQAARAGVVCPADGCLAGQATHCQRLTGHCVRPKL